MATRRPEVVIDARLDRSQADRGMRELSASMTRAARTMASRMVRAYKEIRASLKKYVDDQGRARDALGRFTKMRGALGSLKGAFDGLSKRAKMLAAALPAVALAATAGAFFLTTKRALAFEKALAEVQTIADSTVFTTQKITDLTRELAKSFGADVTKSAQALYATISAGITDAIEAQEILRVSTALAIGGITDTETVVDGLTSTINAYRASQLSATDVADAFFVTVRDGKTKVDQIAASIGQAAPLAAQMGVRFDELLGSMAAITNTGLSTSEAFTQIRGILTAVAKQTQKSQKVVEKFKGALDFSGAALRQKGLIQFLRDITSVSGITDTDLSRLFGRVEALNGALLITANNAQRAGEVMGDLRSRTGAYEAALARMQDTLGFQIDKLKGLTNAAMVAFGTATTESTVAREAVKALNTAMGNMIDVLARPEGKKSIEGFFRLMIMGTASTLELIRKVKTGWDEIITRLEVATKGFSAEPIRDEGLSVLQIMRDIEVGFREAAKASTEFGAQGEEAVKKVAAAAPALPKPKPRAAPAAGPAAESDLFAEKTIREDAERARQAVIEESQRFAAEFANQGKELLKIEADRREIIGELFSAGFIDADTRAQMIADQRQFDVDRLTALQEGNLAAEQELQRHHQTMRGFYESLVATAATTFATMVGEIATGQTDVGSAMGRLLGELGEMIGGFLIQMGSAAMASGIAASSLGTTAAVGAGAALIAAGIAFTALSSALRGSLANGSRTPPPPSTSTRPPGSVGGTSMPSPSGPPQGFRDDQQGPLTIIYEISFGRAAIVGTEEGVGRQIREWLGRADRLRGAPAGG